ncbi:MAG: hypothetical protein WA056_10085 [Gallionella sp.]
MSTATNSSAASDGDFAKRLRAVLDYDGVPEKARVMHLMSRCGLSMYMARKVLNGERPSRCAHATALQEGLEVVWSWLAYGLDAGVFHPRTFRITWQQIDGISKEATNLCMRFLVALKAGHPKARNLADLVNDGRLTALGAAQLMAA